MTMASTTLKDIIGNWQLLLVGLLLSLSPVLEAATSSPSTTAATGSATSAGAGSTAATTLSPSTVTSPTAQTTAPTSQPQSSSQAPTTAPTANTAMTSMGSTMGSTMGPTMGSTMNPTSVAAPGSTNQPMSPSTGAVSTSGPATVSSSVTLSSAMNSSMSTASMGNTTGGWSNGTTVWSNSSMSTISCRSFMCNYSDCYNMYMSQNASMCPYGYNYCELIKQTDICYTVSCSASCSMSCNSSQTNCSVNCCNSTNCLNDTFASMMMTTSTPMMTTRKATTPSPTTRTTTAPTTQSGNKCHKGQCNGTTCYTKFSTLQVCSSSQPHCQLKKETAGSTVQWTAGCTTNCSGQTSCKASTPPPCHLECCNATLTSSCLFLNGTLNVSFATRGPQLHSELFTSVLLVFVISLML